ncbi:MAG: DMT family transporter [Pseudomonadota bacterium]
MILAALGGLSGNARGALWMIGSGVGFTIYLTLAKLLSADAHPVFLAFFRAFLGLLFTLPLLYRNGLSSLKTRRFPLLFTRSLFGSLGFILSLLAVSDFFTLPLSEFNALSFTRPLFVTLLAALVLGETVGPRRVAAIGAGFFGVLVMTAPGVVFFWMPGVGGEGPTLDLAGVLALGSALAFALSIILVKTLSRDHAPTTLLIWANLLSTLLLLGPALFYWSSPGLADWGLIFLMALAGLAAQYCFITAMSIGDASFLSAMDYLRLPMTAVADWLLFNLLPGLFVWLGAAIIITSTLYITLRARRL